MASVAALERNHVMNTTPPTSGSLAPTSDELHVGSAIWLMFGG
jgi:hypothetical protein